MSVNAAFDVQMQFSGSGGAWTSVIGDVRLSPPLAVSYGIRGATPMDRVSDTGTLTLALNNGQNNSAGLVGYYSPGHGNCRAGFELGIGVRVAITYSGSTFYKFAGRLDEVSPVPNIFGERLVYCQAVDWMDEAAKQKVHLLTTQVNQRANQVIAAVVGAMTRLPAASSLAQGQDVFPYAIDNNRDLVDTPKSVFQDVCNSELGFLYIKGDQHTGGVLTFQDRHARPESGSSLGTFSDVMVNMQTRRTRSTIFGHVRNTVHPRRVDASASILFTLRTPQFMQGATAIPPGTVAIVQGTYVDPSGGNAVRAGAFTTCTLVPTTDYLVNTASDGSGINLTGLEVVAASFGANSFQVQFTHNVVNDAWITKLQVRGRGLYDYEPVTLESIDIVSTACFGDNVLTFDMPYQADATGVGQDAADYLRSVWSQPQTRVELVQFVGNNSDALMKAGLAREVSDRVTMVETVTGINGDYYIQGIDFSVEEGIQFRFAWLLSPKDPYDAWILGVAGFSELGVTTIVGY